MAELGEMLDGQSSASLIVESYTGDAILTIRIHHHGWNTSE